ncbi:MAG TPA: glycosyltransferase [Acidimicrobiales bacterium]|nr:glycosyltransferase [Acidimicrobiales bacterium]
MRVMHVITGLESHGAERMMARLIGSLDEREVQSVVVSLTTDGPVGRDLRSSGVEVLALEIKKTSGMITGPRRLAAAIRDQQPDVVQTWLYDSDLIGAIAARRAGRIPVVWNLRQTVPDLRASKPRTRWIIRTCARLSSRAPARIVCCAPEVLQSHVDVGYDASRAVVIPNGTDMEIFRPDDLARCEVRAELGFDAATPLVGLVARVAPQKDHETFASAAAAVLAKDPRARFILCGEGATASNGTLTNVLGRAGVAAATRLLGPRPDVERITAALDVAVSSSAFGEGYPNTVAEALACGVPCVVTDVGHSAALVGDAGVVVPPRDPSRLAEGVSRLLALSPIERRALGAKGRQGIEAEASLAVVARTYAEVWRGVAQCVV